MTTTTEPMTLDDFRGRILQPHDDGYDDARRVWNGAVDRRPAIIACATVDRRTSSPPCEFAAGTTCSSPSAAAGTPSPATRSCDGGLMIDLSQMKGIDVDPVARRAPSQPGVAAGASTTRATQQHGLASPGGEISHTGVAGLTLGGGVGWLSRCHGLACDNLVEVELVTAAGEVLHGSDGRPTPSCCGGCAAAAATSASSPGSPSRCTRSRPMLGGGVMVPLERGREVLRLYRELGAEAPDELSLTSPASPRRRRRSCRPSCVGRPVVGLGRPGSATRGR